MFRSLRKELKSKLL
uniref:Uncharacterized protein n=1 Tax=Arundo donax TaxID=35708 RepID=A0A0A9FN30_ARUDO